MYKQGDYVVYKKDVCKVKNIKHNDINGIDYYILAPIDDDSLIIDVPTDNRMGYLKDIMSKKDAEKLIEKIPKISLIDNIDDKYIERTYKDLFSSGNQEDLVKIIKTSYLRNDNRIKNNKKISDKDEAYFNLAEKYLYNELSVALGMSYNETKEYIINKVNEIVK